MAYEYKAAENSGHPYDLSRPRKTMRHIFHICNFRGDEYRRRERRHVQKCP